MLTLPDHEDISENVANGGPATVLYIIGQNRKKNIHPGQVQDKAFIWKIFSASEISPSPTGLT
jgi:hypothetical protein